MLDLKVLRCYACWLILQALIPGIPDASKRISSRKPNMEMRSQTLAPIAMNENIMTLALRQAHTHEHTANGRVATRCPGVNLIALEHIVL